MHVLGRDAEEGGEGRLRHARSPGSACRWSPGRRPSAATMACGSMALWYCGGVSYHGLGDRAAAAARPASRSPCAKFGRRAEADRPRLEALGRRRSRCAQARPRMPARAGARLRSPPPASRRRRGRWAGWRSARRRPAAPRCASRRGAGLASGSWASGGRFAGVITSTTPGCALAAATSSAVTRPRAIGADGIDGMEHAVGWLSAA